MKCKFWGVAGVNIGAIIIYMLSNILINANLFLYAYNVILKLNNSVKKVEELAFIQLYSLNQYFTNKHFNQPN